MLAVCVTSDTKASLKLPLLRVGSSPPSPQIELLHCTTTAVLWSLYRTACVSWQAPELRTGGFCWSKILLPACPCWRQLVHSDWGGDTSLVVLPAPSPYHIPRSERLWIMRTGLLDDGCTSCYPAVIVKALKGVKSIDLCQWKWNVLISCYPRLTTNIILVMYNWSLLLVRLTLSL